MIVGKFLLIITIILLVSFTSPFYSVAEIHQNNQVQPTNLHATADSSDPPTIDWIGPPANSTNTEGPLVEGAYWGQTEQIFDIYAWVNDTDGVNSVIFRFLHQDNWENYTPTLAEGDEIRGRYTFTLVCNVAWDWETMRPVPGAVGYQVKVFANDSQGNGIETGVYSYSYGFYISMGPLPYILLATPLGWLIMGVSVFAIVAIIRRKIRHPDKSPKVGDDISPQ